MKKIITLIASVLALNTLNAQNYYISFAAAGDTTAIETVTVENLTQSTAVTLSAGDLLHLSSTVEITDISGTREHSISTYPNPVLEKCKVEFVTSAAGNVSLSLHDLSGKMLADLNGFREAGRQIYEISSLRNGAYILGIQSGNSSSFAKILSCGTPYGKVVVSFVGTDMEYEMIKDESNNSLTKGPAAEVLMQYNSGDRIKYTGKSKNYRTIITDIPSGDKSVTFTFAKCKDGDMNNYPVVKIGEQIWMAENLKTTKYRDASVIPIVTDNAAWGGLTSSAFCWYANNEAANKNLYGAIYNRYAVNTGNICPDGWHVPSDSEWKTMEISLGMSQSQADANDWRGTDQGTRLKSLTGWNSGGNGSNASGFSAFPGGYRSYSGGIFGQAGVSGYWWTTTESIAPNAYYRVLSASYSKINRSIYGLLKDGYSVRCLKD